MPAAKRSVYFSKKVNEYLEEKEKELNKSYSKCVTDIIKEKMKKEKI